MTVELHINNSADVNARYVSWAPSPCRIRLTDASGSPTPVVVKISSTSTTTGGGVVFQTSANASAQATLSLTLPLGGAFVPFFVAGKFGHPSAADRDVSIRVHAGTQLIAEVPLMVRIRKNANKLTPSERDRFVAAMARLNNQGAGRFAEFRNMHTNDGSPEAHGAPGFLPWHRAYLLDLERELQALDPSVTLPYWRFDQPAPKLFSPDFLGTNDALGTVLFGPTNPLQFWTTDGIQGINRRPFFNTNTGSAVDVLTEAQTLALGSEYELFQEMEFNPHALAHGSFGGFISSISTAARDPLFFLLHVNVDRLWAKWQRRFGRFDPTQPASFDSNTASGGNRIGHNLADSMWPWNGMTGGGRPPTAPGGGLSDSPCVSAPGPQPAVRDSLDYQGALNAASRLGFDYDDVRFA